MISISLTQGFTAIIDDEDADLAELKWFAALATNNITPYARRNINQSNGKRGALFLHHIVLERMIGRSLVKGEYADHINLNSLDNTRSNLRVVNNSLNQHNRRKQKNNTSGYKGVSYHGQIDKWTARIAMNNKTFNLGVFETPEDAYRAYCQKAIELLGDKARLK